MIEFNGLKLKINEWSKKTGLTRDVIYRRYSLKLTPEQIFKEYIDNNYKQLSRSKRIDGHVHLKISFNERTESPYMWEKITGINNKVIR